MSQDRVRVRGLSIFRPVVYGNTAVVLSPEEIRALPPPPPGTRQHTHKWTVALRSAASAPNSDIVGGADDISYYIRRVSFKLHNDYPNSTRNVDEAPFEVTETGWGEFDIAIRLTFTQESGEKPFTFYHHLKLHPWRLDPVPELPTDPEAMIKREQQELEEARRLGPVHSWQYDEIVFNDPFQGFLNTLMAHPPTPLPRTRSRPVPFHTANPTKEDLHLSRGGVPEFTQEMEILEARRLDEATNAVAEEQNRWQAILEDKEAELATLRAQLGDEL